MRLSELSTGQKGVIVKVLGHGGFRKRIVEMGFIKGKTVEVLLNAPLKDPIKYKVMGYEISLRRQEAEMIEIISEEEAKTLFQREETPQGLHENIPLDDETLKRMALGKRRTINVALVGNPNCGKTSLFNIASGSRLPGLPLPACRPAGHLLLVRLFARRVVRAQAHHRRDAGHHY